MWYLYIISWISYFALLLGFTFALAVALYFLAELVEENTKTSAKVIRTMTIAAAVLYVLLIPLENFPAMMVICGFLAHVCHFMLMQNFPAIQLKSIWFAGTVGLFLLNHFLAFRYFGENYHPFNEVSGYFILFLWIVPMSLIVSLSANDNVLPNYVDNVPSSRSRDTVLPSQSPFAQRKKGGYSLKSLLTYIKEHYLPLVGIGAKKSF